MKCHWVAVMWRPSFSTFLFFHQLKDSMMRICLVCSATLLWAAILSAQDGQLIELDELLVAAPLPPGYMSSMKDLKVDGKIVGQTITVSIPNQPPRVTIQYQYQLRPDPVSRRQAVKEYFDGYAASLVKLGYKTVDKNVLDFDKETFTQPLSMSVLFFNDERKLFTHHEFFFTDKVFLVRATSDNPEILEDLKKWAKSVKPKPIPKS
jgi:hypothetical protein